MVTEHHNSKLMCPDHAAQAHSWISNMQHAKQKQQDRGKNSKPGDSGSRARAYSHPAEVAGGRRKDAELVEPWRRLRRGRRRRRRRREGGGRGGRGRWSGLGSQVGLSDFELVLAQCASENSAFSFLACFGLRPTGLPSRRRGAFNMFI